MTQLLEIEMLKVPPRCLPLAVSLRSLKTTDAATLLALTSANHEALAPWLSWAQCKPTRRHVQEFLRHCVEAEAAGSERHFAILVDGEPSGVLGCAPIDRSNCSVTVGYWLARQHWRKGIASSSLRTLADLLIQCREFERIEARCATGNARGNKTVQLAGFKHEGTLLLAAL